MSSFRNSAKKIIPQAIWHFASQICLGMRHALLAPSAYLHPRRRKSMARLVRYKNLHAGQRAFIIGNGPSIAKTDMAKLKGEITFGLNRVYLAFPAWGYESNYFLSVNDLVIEQSAEDIMGLKMPKFISWRNREFIGDSPETHFLHTTYERPRFARDIRSRIWEGATVTYVALQVAYYMGCDPVILIGVDHSFSSKGKPNTTVVSKGDDRDHFDAKYFGKGFRWQLPDLETSEQSYAMARDAFEADGRQVLDASIGGKLTIFPKVDYDSLF